jgi:hypothetical protein
MLCLVIRVADERIPRLSAQLALAPVPGVSVRQSRDFFGIASPVPTEN